MSVFELCDAAFWLVTICVISIGADALQWNKIKHAQFWLAAGKAMEQTLIPVEYVGYGAEYVK